MATIGQPLTAPEAGGKGIFMIQPLAAENSPPAGLVSWRAAYFFLAECKVALLGYLLHLTFPSQSDIIKIIYVYVHSKVKRIIMLGMLEREIVCYPERNTNILK